MFILNSRFLTQNLTGVQRYGYELFKQLNNLTDNVKYVLPEQPVNKSYKLADDLNIIKTGKNKSHIWEQSDLPAYLNKAGKPLLVNLCSTAPIFYKNQIVTIHDIAYLRGNWHSRSFRSFYKLVTPAIIKNSKHVITVSEFSKQEIIDVYKTPASKISVVYNAPFTVKDTGETVSLDLKKPYLLSVGSIDPRKNLKRLIKAFLDMKDIDIPLYLIGAYNPNFKTDPELDALLKKHNERIIFLGYRTDAELVYFYKNALCFIYPSLYEGFGLPPIEAMANGCPVITSNVSSLPEVCGDGALFCDPLSVNDITEKMTYIAGHKTYREDFIQKGLINIKRFSWLESGKNLMAVINNHV